MSLSDLGRRRWIEPFIWSALALFVIGVLTETAGRYLRAWPPVEDVRVELLEREVPRGGTLPVEISAYVSRSGCLLHIRREIRLSDGLWMTVLSQEAERTEVGSYNEVIEVPLEPEWEPGMYYYRSFATFDCHATELVGGRQYHNVLRGPYVFRIVEEDE